MRETNGKETMMQGIPTFPPLAPTAPTVRLGFFPTLLLLVIFPSATLFLACSATDAGNLAGFTDAAGLFTEADDDKDNRRFIPVYQKPVRPIP